MTVVLHLRFERFQGSRWRRKDALNSLSNSLTLHLLGDGFLFRHHHDLRGLLQENGSIELRLVLTPVEQDL